MRTLISVLWLAAALLARADSAADARRGFIAHARAAGGAAFTFDAAAYEGDVSALPIGVFDSGIGGLTVLEAILELDAFDNDTLRPGADGRRDFEKERFIYLGDQANMPYGNYAGAGREAFLRELILKDAAFLLGRRWRAEAGGEPRYDKPPVKAIVIACNTATAFGLEDVRAAVAAWKLPVIVAGVVEAGARGVGEGIRPGGPRQAVAVLATVGTCNTKAYPKAIGRTVGLAGKSNPVVVQQGCVSLAGAIEGDPAFLKSAKGSPRTLANIVSEDVRSLLESYRGSGGGPPISSVVLGCTHFPLAIREIGDAFASLRGEPKFGGLIAKQLVFVNPAELTAKELFRGLALARLRSKTDKAGDGGRAQFFISVPNPRCAEAKLAADGSGLDGDYKHSRLPGRLSVEDTVVIPMRLEALPAASANLIRTKLPNVAAEMR